MAIYTASATATSTCLHPSLLFSSCSTVKSFSLRISPYPFLQLAQPSSTCSLLNPRCLLTLRPRASSLTTETMIPPYNVLITGSTKGIGYALAKEFLKEGDNVVICSRSAERVEDAVQSLSEEFGKQHVVPGVMSEMAMM